MRKRTFFVLLVWLAGWLAVAAALAGLFYLVVAAAPRLSSRLLPFLLVDLFVVFPLVSVAATHFVWPRLWSSSRRTHVAVRPRPWRTG